MTDLALIVPLCIVLVKLVDRLIDAVISHLHKDSTFTREDKNSLSIIKSDINICKNQIQSLEVLHSARDENGLPLWYVPRGLETSIVEVINMNGKISYSQDDISKTLEKMAGILKDMDKEQGIIAFQINDLTQRE